MASSPTSSCASSYSSPFASSSTSPPEFSRLPIMAMKKKIVEKIQENRVTLIVGETGCGKSSQVPQFLLEENMEPILCTQPRRFAVVAVARMVAKARCCEVGGEIGYHIGHSRVFSSRSKIVFKTAGVLLDEMQEKGLNALKYKVIILDEVHERSVESDLVLVCLKRFLLRKNDLRLVLMSATADIERYREYFRDLGRGERVEVLAIPSAGQRNIFQQKVLYLEQVSELLQMQSSSELLCMKYCSGQSPLTADANVKPEVHNVIHDLVLHIHKNEPDIEKSILVFLPTYYSLEQQWFLLKRFSTSFKIHILHRSVDTEQALKAMKIWKSHRKVILATNIAESSVTIPKVGYVIDSCRSLQVFWDSNRRTDSAELVWVSKSQAEQRRGRTGRTCDGQVYRLVTGSFYSQLEEYEAPAILRLSLRQQILNICCSESKAINDPKVLLQKALDPPDSEVVEDALDLLVHVQALEKAAHRGRFEPTFYGRLLASFSLSFDASVLILKFGDMGMLREGILIGTLMDMQPHPILRPFGQENLFMEYTNNFYHEDSKKTGLTGKREVLYMGNLCAYQFWQHAFKGNYRLERLKKHLKFEGSVLVSETEEEWCFLHNLVLSALRQVEETYDEILNSLHRFRPKSFVKSNGLPCYCGPYEFQHVCFLESVQDGEPDLLAVDEQQLDVDSDTRKCVAAPYVPSNYFQTDEVARKLATVIKEMRTQSMVDISENQQPKYVSGGSPHAYEEAPLCKFFINGLCNRGSQCFFSHSLQARRPACKYFFSLQGCRNGESCVFSHDAGPSVSSGSLSSPCLPEDGGAYPDSLLRLLPVSQDEHILFLNDDDLHFTSCLARLYNPSSILSTTSMSESSIHDPVLRDVRVFWGLTHPYGSIFSKAWESAVPWTKIKCILWFPTFDSEHLEEQKTLLQTVFEYLATRILADSLYELQIVLTMNNIRFSQFQVEKLATENLLILKESFPFDESSFGEFYDGVPCKKPMLVSRPISYVFHMHPPTDIYSGDFAAAIHHC